jgi:hypothetical protein
VPVSALSDGAVEFFQNGFTHPERISAEEAQAHPASFPLGYWETVYNLLLVGNFNTVVQLLRLHSEIGLILQSEGKNSFTTIQYEQLADVLETLLNHPYNVETLPVNPSDAFIRDVEDALDAWKVQIHAHATHPQSILYAIPEFEIIFRICLQDTNVLGAYTQGDWQFATLTQLLYHYSPRLHRRNFYDLFKRNMTTAYDAQVQQVSSEEQRTWLKQQAHSNSLYLSIIANELGVVMQSLYEAQWSYQARDSLIGYQIKREISTLLLFAIAHLSRLLVAWSYLPSFGEQVTTSIAHKELITIMASSPHETSFLEEITLEGIQLLTILGYPIEVNYYSSILLFLLFSIFM